MAARDLLHDAQRFARRAAGAVRRRVTTTRPAADRTGFYAAGDPGPGRRGEVLATEPMPAPLGAVAWRVRYRTVDAAGRPVAASMALATPAAGGPERPVVVWVHGALGVAPGCGPSRTGFEAWYADELLAAGAVVVAADLTGLGIEGVHHPYLHGTTAGRSVLDAARAAADLPASGAGDVVVLLGHSAGGHAVLWANELAAGQDEDLPGGGLDVRLTVPIAPVGDLGVAMTHFATGVGMAAFPVQLAATWPAVEPVATGAALTPAALRRLDDLASKRLDGLLHSFGGDGSRWVRAGGFDEPAWNAALERQSAGRRAGAGPVLLAHGGADDAVPPGWSIELAATMEDAGQRVTLRTFPTADHHDVMAAAADEILAAVRAATS